MCWTPCQRVDAGKSWQPLLYFRQKKAGAEESGVSMRELIAINCPVNSAATMVKSIMNVLDMMVYVAIHFCFTIVCVRCFCNPSTRRR